MGKPLRNFLTTWEKEKPYASLVTWVIVGTWLFFKGESTTEPSRDRGRQGIVADIPGNEGYGRDMVIFFKGNYCGISSPRGRRKYHMNPW